MVKKYWKLILIFVIIIIIGAGYYRFYYQSRKTDQESIDPRLVMEVEKGSIVKTIAGEGYIEPVNQQDLSFPARSSGSTRVKKIYVKEGDRVEEEQLLMELDTAEARLNYLQKQNQYNRARINGSKTEIEEARLQMELAADDLENLKLTAPFSGIITDVYLEEGDYYSSGEAATIKDISRLEIEVNIEESNIPDIKLDQQVRVTLASLSGKEINGQVTSIENEADNSGGTVLLPVVVTLDKVDYDIKLGTSAELDIITGEERDKIVIPITAIHSSDGREVVYKVVDGKIKPVSVSTGLNNGLEIAVKSGLEEGDKIIKNTFQQGGVMNDNQFGGGMPAMRPGGGRR